ncbi:MAG: hypothetical protein HQL63_16010 [Magnetococcales bacterium]|nr:hypothetical protein [Magnetococcales bacterium]
MGARSAAVLAANAAYQKGLGRGKELTGLHCFQVSHDYEAPCDDAGENCPLKVSMQSGFSERMLHIH